jgi:hypothetical protein
LKKTLLKDVLQAKRQTTGVPSLRARIYMFCALIGSASAVAALL